MRILRYLLPIIALLFFALPAAEAQSVQEAYKRGVQLYNQQKYAEALVIFDAVIKAKPDFVYARRYAAKCKTALASNVGPKNDLEGQLSKVMLPAVEFKAAPIGDVLQFISKRTSQISGGSVNPNFIYKGSAEQRANSTVSLNLRNVPVTEVIRYIGQLTRTKFTYEEHAIVADPNYQDKLNAAAQKAAAEEEAAKSNRFFEQPVKDIFD